MKIETCVFSGLKIYPGHGKRAVRADGKVHIFLNKKSVRFAGQKRNPRDVRWTVLYRRKHKKGTHAEEGTQKKRVKRTVQVASRAIGSTSLDAILALRNQTAEFRRAQRDQAIKQAKDQNRKKVNKNAPPPKMDKKAVSAAQKSKAPKPAKAPKPQVGGKR